MATYLYLIFDVNWSTSRPVASRQALSYYHRRRRHSRLLDLSSANFELFISVKRDFVLRWLRLVLLKLLPILGHQ